MTIDEFIAKHQLEMRLSRLLGRTDHFSFDDTWNKTARHWQFKIERIGFGPSTEFIGEYSQGSAHKNPPKFRDVLDCLALHARSTDQSFEDWCSDFGYDTDSRNAQKTYEACAETRTKLMTLLGRDALREFLTEVEPL